MIDIEAIRARHLDPGSVAGRTMYEGHVSVDLASLCDEVERLRAEVDAERAAVVATLRRAARYRFPAAGGLSPGGYIEVVLDLIERGQHRGIVT